ncbi:MAG: UDP-glucose 4-epimerase GalE, partial [Candidatus Eisenbacteria bacterium]|nr:UDP-glucose 4-epimerase GalE [Candidatus Eisenbacteria bacterium]
AESVAHPIKYYRNNVGATMNLLEACLEVGVGRFIFSSTAALYGEPLETPITEEHRLLPINPYGWSKLMGEQVLRDASTAFGIRFVAFRYFNAAGADSAAGLGEDHRPETHLIPLAIKAAMGLRDELKVYGTDYDTRDGSCIRDYVHVSDLADAHLRGLEYLEGGGESISINLGTETGTSVLEIIEAVERVTGLKVPHQLDERRPGDPAVLVASNGLAKKVLGWTPKRDLDQMIEAAYSFFKSNPDGYPEVEGNPEGWPRLAPAEPTGNV